MAARRLSKRRASSPTPSDTDFDELGVSPLKWDKKERRRSKKAKKGIEKFMRLETTTPCTEELELVGSKKPSKELIVEGSSPVTPCSQTAEKESVCWFECLPNELIVNIFKYLNRKTMKIIPFVCRRFAHLFHDSSLWPSIRVESKLLTLEGLHSLLSCNPQCLTLTDCVLEPLPQEPVQWSLSCLKCLRVQNCQVSDQDMARIFEIAPNVVFLDCDSTPVGNTSLYTIARVYPHLEFLSLRMVRTFTDAALCAVVEACSGLVSLNLSWTSIGRLGTWAVTRSLPCLRDLDLCGCTELVNDQDIFQLLTTARGLRMLEISDCYEVTDASVYHMVAHCPELVAVGMSRSPNVTMAALTTLLLNKPTLRQVVMYGCTPAIAAQVRDINRAVSFNMLPFSVVDLSLAHAAMDFEGPDQLGLSLPFALPFALTV